ncbi:MAG: hypothetical protein MZW92_61135 [Comamonadaceae bacterium]|nr:hypothetical protein [Comamonadaceae bacterium]
MCSRPPPAPRPCRPLRAPASEPGSRRSSSVSRRRTPPHATPSVPGSSSWDRRRSSKTCARVLPPGAGERRQGEVRRQRPRGLRRRRPGAEAERALLRPGPARRLSPKIPDKQVGRVPHRPGPARRKGGIGQAAGPISRRRDPGRAGLRRPADDRRPRGGPGPSQGPGNRPQDGSRHPRRRARRDAAAVRP